MRHSRGQYDLQCKVSANDTLILCYHAISDTWDDSLAVRQGRLDDQLSLLKRLGYRGVTFTEAVTGQPGGRRVAVTFDDAFHSVLNLALPVLEQGRWPATVFVVTDYSAGDRLIDWPRLDAWLGTAHEPELGTLCWQELRELRTAGWEVGSHTCSHPHLTKLEGAERRRELAESREICEAELGGPCLSVAYPYGDCDQSVVAMAAEVGYRTAAALPIRPHPIRPLEWPRVGVYHSDWLARFALKAMPLTRRFRAHGRT